MSEYQYYEFVAIDRPLSAEDQRELRSISSRAEITSGSFVNTYNWGNLRGDPEKMLLRWFDAYLYISNFGSYQLSFRVPRGVLRAEELGPYAGEALSYREDARHLAIHLRLDEEEPRDDWFEHEGLLGRLLPLRSALVSGDHRCLYLAWLLDVQMGHAEEDDEEPPVPPGLGERDAALEAFIELMRLDEDLVSAAAEASGPRSALGPGRDAILAWLASRKSKEKDAWLLRAFEGDGARLGIELLRRFRDDHPEVRPEESTCRSVSALLERAEALGTERRERAVRERRERDQREAAQREALRKVRLDGLAGRDEELWSEVRALVAQKKPTAYDRAVLLLADLRDLAAREARVAEWSARLDALREANKTKRSLLQRLEPLGRAGTTG
jgi:hypothetical protein